MSRKHLSKRNYRKCHVAVVGTGTLGRQVAILLAGVGVQSMSLYDPHLVCKPHLVGQGFFEADLGMNKVDAVADLAHQYHPQMELLTYQKRIDPEMTQQWKSYSTTAVFVCANSLRERRRVWSLVKGHAQFYSEGIFDHTRIVVLSTAICNASNERPPFSETRDHSRLMKGLLVPASLTASLMVSQFIRWQRDLPVVRKLSCKL